jgi:hypothetical protein
MVVIDARNLCKAGESRGYSKFEKGENVIGFMDMAIN